MKLLLIFIAAVALSINLAIAGQHAAKIGKAVVVENSVDLITDQGAFEIVVGTDIRTRQTVNTGENSSSQFTMSDDTRLAVGPNSQLLLDEFVYDPNPSNRKVVLKSLKGALRFVTGKNPSNTYTINTPTAVIGVRGTMFDIYINDNGETVVGLLKGKVNVCPPGSRQCQDLQTAGRFLSIDRQGRIRKADRPDRAMLGNISFAMAFPFLGGTKRLRGKLAAPGKLRQQIRKKAGLRDSPRKKIKRKAIKRKAIKRKAIKPKAVKRKAVRKRVRPVPPGRKHKVTKRRKPVTAKIRLKTRKRKPPKRKQTGKRKKQRGKINGIIIFPLPGSIYLPGKKKTKPQ